MNSVKHKYKSVEQIAMRDIADYHRNLFKDKHVSLLRKNMLSANHVFTKDARRLNRELGLHLVKTKKQLIYENISSLSSIILQKGNKPYSKRQQIISCLF